MSDGDIHWQCWSRRGLTFAGTLAAQEGAGAAVAEPRSEAQAAAFRWTDPDGKPLPFKSEDELLVFLRDRRRQVGEAASAAASRHPTKILLEKDGIRSDAIFRDVNEERSTPTFGARPGRPVLPRQLHLRARRLPAEPSPGPRQRPARDPAQDRQQERQRADLGRERHDRKGDGEAEPPAARPGQRWNKQLQMINVFDALVLQHRPQQRQPSDHARLEALDDRPHPGFPPSSPPPEARLDQSVRARPVPAAQDAG